MRTALRPRRVRQHPDSSATASELGDHRAADPLRILLVDDRPTAAMRIQQILSRSDAVGAIATADGTEAALEHTSVDAPGAVLLALRNGREGLDTLIALSHAAPAIPIVVMTDDPDDRAGLDAIALGAQDYVSSARATAEGLVRSIRCARARQGVVASLRGQSLSDELTGLLNRRGFQTMAGTHLRLGNRTASRFLLLFADLDGLKRINDGHGHHEGDQALAEAADVLRGTFRQSDVVARYGGDEFAILALDSAEDYGQAVLHRLRDRLDAVNADPSRRYALQLSLGGVAFDARHDQSLQQLLAEADRALYAEKRARTFAVRR